LGVRQPIQGVVAKTGACLNVRAGTMEHGFDSSVNK
jgi:hypothetical protein